jgi:murein L,D-transpeptidase YcbB/YkuD
MGRAIDGALHQTGADQGVAAFYAARDDQPLWIDGQTLRPEAFTLLAMLRDAAEDGLQPQTYQPETLERRLEAAASGERRALAGAEIALSGALAAYAADLRRPAPGASMAFTDPQLQPPRTDAASVLGAVAGAPSLAEGLAAVRRMNPVYQGLRRALIDPRTPPGLLPLIRANLERARALPADLGRRFVLVDVTAARLWYVQDGHVQGGMRVVVGKPSEATPSLAGVIRTAVLHPYWNVPPDLVRDSIAPAVLASGQAYLEQRHLEVLSDWSDQARPVDAAAIDWQAAATGAQVPRVRQTPGPDNMMGAVKFEFPNRFGVYLHDTPLRGLFRGSRRTASSGCVRLEDAPALARWLMGASASAISSADGQPEQRVSLPEPVPVYIVYFTALPGRHGVAVRPDIYRRDPALEANLSDRPADIL